MFFNRHNNKISIRPFEPSGAKLFMIWDTDSEVQNFIPEPFNIETNIEEQFEYIKECNDAIDELHGMIVDNNTQIPIGTISITEINEYHGVGELGIILGNKEFWNKGYASEAIKLTIEHIRENTNIRRLLAECEVDNLGMRKVLEKNGFYIECISLSSRIKNGGPIDTARYVWLK